MKYQKILILVTLLFTPFILLLGQNYINLARLSYDISNNNSFDSEVGETSLKELSFDLNIPIRLSKKEPFLLDYYMKIFSYNYTLMMNTPLYIQSI